MSEAAQWKVRVGDEETTAVLERALTTRAKAAFVFAHGAGTDMSHRSMQQTAETLRARSFDVVRFNFLYREQGSKRPDPMPRLQACMAAVIARTRAELEPRTLVIGGRSMGGRAASMLAADGLACDGLLLLAYPLHPAGKPEKLRDAHLTRIDVPVLCFNGTRDTLCTRALMERAVVNLKTWEMHWLDGADHGFHVLKSSGRTDAGVLKEIGDVTADWLARIAG